MIPDFLVTALLAGLCVAAVAGPLGSLVVWQRLAYFGDTLAHSALLGAALGLVLAVTPTYTVIATALLLAALLSVLQERLSVASDTLLGILSHASLALGLVLLSLVDTVRFDLNSYLFGDLLAVGSRDLVLIAVIAAVVFALLVKYWNSLLALTVHDELAQVEGLPVRRLRLLLMLLIALLVAVAIKIIGVLLITALLIIPAAAARPLARSPEQMAALAIGCGALSVIGGLQLSLWTDTPAGPSVVVAAAFLFLLSILVPKRR